MVRIGQHGVTDSVLAELEVALDHHELLKIKISVGEREARDAVIDQLAAKTRASVIQRIGNILVLYRKKPETPAAKPRGGAGSKTKPARSRVTKR